MARWNSRGPLGPAIEAGREGWIAQDWLLALLLAMVVGVACLFIADTIPSFLLQSMDFWFEADTLREVSNMTRVHDDHYRTSVHPLFSLLTFIPVYAVKHGLSMSPLQAVLLVTSVIGGLWIGMLYVLLRLLGCRKLDASVFTLLGLCSASALFWLPVPNSYSWGSLSIMLALVLLLLTEQRTFGAAAYVVASALTLSVTVTNWMAGLLVTLVRWPWKQAAQLSINALCLVVLLWGVQKFIFPSAEFFIGSRGETSFINHPQAGNTTNVASSFVFHSLIAPAVRFIKDDAYTQVNDDSFRLSERLTFQFSGPGSAGPLGVHCRRHMVCAASQWIMAIVDPDWSCSVSAGAGAVARFELALHMLYGEETFTYSLNFVPLLIAVAALGALSPGRPLVLGLASSLSCAPALITGSNSGGWWSRPRSSHRSARS